MKNELQKLYLHRLRNLSIMLRLLRLVPFCRCIILNGSMAEGKVKANSDIDILIIAKSGRIFTCRAAVLFWATLSGLKRSSRSKNDHAGRFCFNYFLTDKFLIIPHNRGEKVDKYCAENYSKSVLLAGDQKLFEKFMTVNDEWMEKYLPLLRHPALDAGSTNSSRSISRFPIESGMTDKGAPKIQNFFERLLAGGFGNWVEEILKQIQIKRIKRDPAVKKYPKYIVFNDKELRFHSPK